MAKRKDGPRYGLSKNNTHKKSRDFLDMDYINKLTDSEIRWMDKFCREYYQNHFTNSSRDKHDTKELKRRCYSNENSRERDMWNKFFRTDGNLIDCMPDTDDEDEDEDET